MATLSGPLQTFMNPKYKGIEKCTSLILDGWQDSSFTSKILALFPKALSSLQHLFLSHFVDPENGSQFPNCLSLERVEISSHEKPIPPFWGSNFACVTTLSFVNTNTWADFDIATLSLFPLLDDLTLFTTEEALLFGEFDSLRPVQFQFLQILRVHGAIPPVVLTRLVAPALEELYIEANALYTTPIKALLSSFGLSCLHLHALLPKGISLCDPTWATFFSKLVQKCPRLETLYISKWMEKECKKFADHSTVVLHVL